MKIRRKIIEIDEEKCNGCGLCAKACHEGAIQMIQGKAKLVSDIYCDGLGDCIGECPVDAIRIIERDAEKYDEEAVKEKMAQKTAQKPLPCGCPGTFAKSLQKKHVEETACRSSVPAVSELQNWPVQLKLVPVTAPYFNDNTLLIAADCVGFSAPDFHRSYLKDKILVIACPKLDDGEFYLEKLAQIFTVNTIKSVEVVIMEVPCCSGLTMIVKKALEKSGKNIPFSATRIGIDGNVIETFSA